MAKMVAGYVPVWEKKRIQRWSEEGTTWDGSLRVYLYFIRMFHKKGSKQRLGVYPEQIGWGASNTIPPPPPYRKDKAYKPHYKSVTEFEKLHFKILSTD